MLSAWSLYGAPSNASYQLVEKLIVVWKKILITLWRVVPYLEKNATRIVLRYLAKVVSFMD